ncbi:MAG: MarR family transcriptional regulator [Bacteroidales bacterium]|nr:MarR family transcriptional regulator [Bacteroidales bacterium]
MNLKEQLIAYIKEIVGFEIIVQEVSNALNSKLPLYLKEEYKWYHAILEQRDCLFAVIDDANYAGISQTGKHFEKIKNITGMPVIAVFNNLEAYNRKRFIEKKIAFVVPGKQLYIPELIIDLKEYSNTVKKKTSTISPVAQQLLLLFLLDKQNTLHIEEKTFKDLAALLETNPMGVTRAVESLKNHDLIEVMGEKEKKLRFLLDRLNLWKTALTQNIFINPVMRQIYIDELPQNIKLLRCYDNALTEYTDINPVRQEYYAIEKNMYQAFKKTNALINENKYEGRYCIEVWKYNPSTIIKLLFEDAQVVDPLSLFLCYKDTHDERIEMAMEQIEKEFIW